MGKMSGGYATIGLTPERTFHVHKSGHVAFRVGDPGADETVHVLDQTEEMEMFGTSGNDRGTLERRAFTAGDAANPNLAGSRTGITHSTRNTTAIQRLDQWLETFLLDTPPPPSEPRSETSTTAIDIGWTNIPQQQFAWTDGTCTPYVHELRVEYVAADVFMQAKLEGDDLMVTPDGSGTAFVVTPLLTFVPGNKYVIEMVSTEGALEGPLRFYDASGSMINEGIGTTESMTTFTVPTTTTVASYNLFGRPREVGGVVAVQADPFADFVHGEMLFFTNTDAHLSSQQLVFSGLPDGLQNRYISAACFMPAATLITHSLHRNDGSTVLTLSSPLLAAMPAGTAVLIGAHSRTAGIVQTGATAKGKPTVTDVRLRYEAGTDGVDASGVYVANHAIDAGVRYHVRVCGTLKFNPTAEDHSEPKYLDYPEPLATKVVGPPSAPRDLSGFTIANLADRFFGTWTKPQFSDANAKDDGLPVTQYRVIWESAAPTGAASGSLRFLHFQHSAIQLIPGVPNAAGVGDIADFPFVSFKNDNAKPTGLTINGSYSITAATSYTVEVDAKNPQNVNFGDDASTSLRTELPPNLGSIKAILNSNPVSDTTLPFDNSLHNFKQNIVLDGGGVGVGNYVAISSKTDGARSPLSNNTQVLAAQKINQPGELNFLQTYAPTLEEGTAGILSFPARADASGNVLDGYGNIATYGRGSGLLQGDEERAEGGSDDMVARYALTIDNAINAGTTMSQDFEGFGGTDVGDYSLRHGADVYGIPGDVGGENWRYKLTSIDQDLFDEYFGAANLLSNPNNLSARFMHMAYTGIYKYARIDTTIKTGPKTLEDGTLQQFTDLHPPRETGYVAKVKLSRYIGNLDIDVKRLQSTFYVDDLQSRPNVLASAIYDIGDNSHYEYVSGIPGYKVGAPFDAFVSVDELARYFLRHDGHHIEVALKGFYPSGTPSNIGTYGQFAVGKVSNPAFNIDGIDGKSYYSVSDASPMQLTTALGGVDASGVLLDSSGSAVQIRFSDTLKPNNDVEEFYFMGDAINAIASSPFKSVFADASPTTSVSATFSANVETLRALTTPNRLRCDHTSIAAQQLIKSPTDANRDQTVVAVHLRLIATATFGATEITVDRSDDYYTAADLERIDDVVVPGARVYYPFETLVESMETLVDGASATRTRLTLRDSLPGTYAVGQMFSVQVALPINRGYRVHSGQVTPFEGGSNATEFPPLSYDTNFALDDAFGYVGSVYDNEKSLLDASGHYDQELMMYRGQFLSKSGTSIFDAYKNYEPYAFKTKESPSLTDFSGALELLSLPNYANVSDSGYRWVTFKFDKLVKSGYTFKYAIIRLIGIENHGSYNITGEHSTGFMVKPSDAKGYDVLPRPYVPVYLKIVDPNNVKSDYATFGSHVTDGGKRPTYSTTWLDAGRQALELGIGEQKAAENNAWYCRPDGIGCLDPSFSSSLSVRNAIVQYNTATGGSPDSNAIAFVKVGLPMAGANSSVVSLKGVSLEVIPDDSDPSVNHPRRQSAFRVYDNGL